MHKESLPSQQKKMGWYRKLKMSIADIDMIDIVKSYLNDQNELLNMNNIKKTYNILLGVDEDAEVNYKRYLKNLFSETLET